MNLASAGPAALRDPGAEAVWHAARPAPRHWLQLHTAWGAQALTVVHCRVHEAAHAAAPLWAEVEAFSHADRLPLKAVMGEPAQLLMHGPGGQARAWQGVVVQAVHLGSDGGLAHHRLTLGAWTHWLSLRRDTRIFQDQTARDTLQAVFAAYPQARVRFDVPAPGPWRAITTQYRETDWAFAQRLMAQEGWSWRLEHAPAEPPLPGRAPTAQATLVVVDDAWAERPDLGRLREGRPVSQAFKDRGLDFGVELGRGLDWDLGSDLGWLVPGGQAVHEAVTAWRELDQVGPNAVTLAAWDERQLSGVVGAASLPHAATAAHRPTHTRLPRLEDYRGHGERLFADGRVDAPHGASAAVAQQRAQARLAHHGLRQRQFRGDSTVRALRPGAAFALAAASVHEALAAPGGEGRCVLTEVVHEAANNLGLAVAQRRACPELAEGRYRNHFTAVTAEARLVPPAPEGPRAPGPQTAWVMASPGQAVATDRDGRIRIQFAWQRGDSPLPGAPLAPLTPTGLATGHAPGDARSGTWVRVAQAFAGPDSGTVFTPRAGTEVVVDFVDGDIDRPLVVGQLHNGQHNLPWPAGEGTDTNHRGTLSGWHRPWLDGQGANQWLIDDAPGQLRMRLLSHGAAGGHHELTLGHIVQHSPHGGQGHAQRGHWLGEGFYGHTDGWATVRAGHGLLLSTRARPARGSSVQGTQMGAAEAVSQLHAAAQLGRTLGQSANRQGALGLSSLDRQGVWQAHTEALDSAAHGRFDGTQGGQVTRQAVPGGRALGDDVERFALPLLHLDAASTAAFVTPARLAVYSGQDTSWVTHGDVHLAARGSLSAVSGQTTSLYTHGGGIQVTAAHGTLSLRAHSATQQLGADQDLTVHSTTDEVRIQARQRITLSAGSSQIVLEGGNITFTCPGTWTVKGARQDWGAGAADPAALSPLPSGVRALAEPPAAPLPVYGLALSLAEVPAAWLPHPLASQVQVIHHGEPLTEAAWAGADTVSAPLLFNRPAAVQLWLRSAPTWQVSEDVWQAPEAVAVRPVATAQVRHAAATVAAPAAPPPGVSVVFLDALRHPIANLPYRLDIGGQRVTGQTTARGQVPPQATHGAPSPVLVWVQDAQRRWQKLASTVAGAHHTLVTLVSDAIVLPATLRELPRQAAIAGHRPQAPEPTEHRPPTPSTSPKPPGPPASPASPARPKGRPSKNNPAVTSRQAQGPQGLPTIVIGVDVPEGLTDHFDHFQGGEIAESDWALVARGLACEPEVLKAIAKVESGGRSAFWRLAGGHGEQVPAILYERHYFSRQTAHVHDKAHPDVSWPVGYQTRSRLGKVDQAMHDGKVGEADVYASYATSYLRLLNAYRLDADAALRSCSWGKFQIMGANHGLCEEPDLRQFVDKMCTSEAAQIGLLAAFIRNKPRAWKDPKNKKLGKEISLWDAVKTKDWRAIAFNYNGPAYETHSYHTKLQSAYEQYKSVTQAKQA